MDERRRRHAAIPCGRGGVRAPATSFALTVSLLVVVGPGCTGGSGDGARPRSEPSTGRTAERVAEVEDVVASLRPGSAVGFDDAAWRSAVDPAAVLPPGSTVRVVDDSTVVAGDVAATDVIVSSPGRPSARSWMFLHVVDGRWSVFGSLPVGPTR